MDALVLIEMIALIYFVISVPKQLFERFKKKRNGEVFSPAKLIAKKLLKSWLITGIFLIPILIYSTYSYLESAGLPQEAIIDGVFPMFFIAIRDSIVLGYIFVMAFRHRWSYSANEWNFEKINNLK